MEYRELFGIDFNVTTISVSSLPVYLTAGRSFYMLSHNETKFLLVKVSEKEKFGVLALEKQAGIISEKYGIPVAFDFSNVTRPQRDSLINNNIPFISESGQLYLPFLGMALSNRFTHQKDVKKEKMMPVTQALFLLLLYSANGGSVLKKDAAETLGVTRTSITRASDQLDAMGLIKQEVYGKECHMYANGQGLQLFEMAKPYLINPIQRTAVVQYKKQNDSYSLSGESALAERTMLNNPKISVRAVYKDEADFEQIQEIDTRWAPNVNVMQLEFWKYNPQLFSKHGVVDPVSLYMCFENNVDERIEEAIEEYLEDYKW